MATRSAWLLPPRHNPHWMKCRVRRKDGARLIARPPCSRDLHRAHNIGAQIREYEHLLPPIKSPIWQGFGRRNLVVWNGGKCPVVRDVTHSPEIDRCASTIANRELWSPHSHLEARAVPAVVPHGHDRAHAGPVSRQKESSPLFRQINNEAHAHPLRVLLNRGTYHRKGNQAIAIQAPRGASPVRVAWARPRSLAGGRASQARGAVRDSRRSCSPASSS